MPSQVPGAERGGNDEARAAQAAENRARKDLGPLDQAVWARDSQVIYGWDRKRIAEALGVSSAAVSRLLGLLDHGRDVLGLVQAGTLKTSAALALRGHEPERIAEAVGRVRAGEKPAAIIRELQESARAAENRRHRTLADLMAALRILEWIEGVQGITLEDAQLHDLGEVQVRRAG